MQAFKAIKFTVSSVRVSTNQIKKIDDTKIKITCKFHFFYRWCYYFEAEFSKEHQINLVPQLLFTGTQDFETGMMMYNSVKIKNDWYVKYYKHCTYQLTLSLAPGNSLPDIISTSTKLTSLEVFCSF